MTSLNPFVVEQESLPIYQSNPSPLTAGASSIDSPATLTREACRCRHLEEFLPHILNLEAVLLRRRDDGSSSSSSTSRNRNNTTTTSNNSSSSATATYCTEVQLVNPVHALHLRSHLDNPSAATFTFANTNTSTAAYGVNNSDGSHHSNQNNQSNAHSSNNRTPMLLMGGGVCLYGEEQLRTQALLMEGISESWSQTLHAIRPPPAPPTQSAESIVPPPPSPAAAAAAASQSETLEVAKAATVTSSTINLPSSVTAATTTTASPTATATSATTTPTTVLSSTTPIATTSSSGYNTDQPSSHKDPKDAALLPDDRYTALLKNENQLLLIRHKLAAAATTNPRKKPQSSSATTLSGSRQFASGFFSSSSYHHPMMMKMSPSSLSSAPTTLLSPSSVAMDGTSLSANTSSNNNKRRKTGTLAVSMAPAAPGTTFTTTTTATTAATAIVDSSNHSNVVPSTTTSTTAVTTGDTTEAAPVNNSSTTGASGTRPARVQRLQQQRQQQYRNRVLADQAKSKVELWMNYFRLNRRMYWQEQKQRQQVQQQQQQQQKTKVSSQQTTLNPNRKNELPKDFFASHKVSSSSSSSTSSSGSTTKTTSRRCQACHSSSSSLSASSSSPQLFTFSFDPWNDDTMEPCACCTQDDLMQCLECSFVGCWSSSSSSSSSSSQPEPHMLQHMLLTGHGLAVTCGARAEVFCFSCCDIVYHSLFDQERERLDLYYGFLPWMAWKEHPVQRSFDASSFVRTEEHGLVWRGLLATYPMLVPLEHVQAARLSLQRKAMFQGRLEYPRLSVSSGHRAIGMTSFQLGHANDRAIISAPVGMYNLGNTCFQSAILQCLIHSLPIQLYFLRDVGHDHRSCVIYRKAATATSTSSQAAAISGKTKGSDVCLACEMDILFLQYMGRSIGRNILAALADVDSSAERSESEMRKANYDDQHFSFKGEPLVTADMLTVAWKSGGMDHLVGYEQRDAHEYLHAFLEILEKHVKQYRDCLFSSLNQAGPYAALKQETVLQDAMKKIFEGTLRSVLICEECGNKRNLSEPFLSVSLPLSKEVERRDSVGGKRGMLGKGTLSLESCLEHFTAPEQLSDPVDCPSCKKKTPTKKQNSFSKLPKILCFHLKRFDAAQNKKIDDFVAFPARSLNLGVYLPHWCEAARSPSMKNFPSGQDESYVSQMQILYDLSSTVNHQGTLQSGHYVTNVKVKDQWYHCNDAHVTRAGEGSGENVVLTSDGAYLLFYTRR